MRAVYQNIKSAIKPAHAGACGKRTDKINGRISLIRKTAMCRSRRLRYRCRKTSYSQKHTAMRRSRIAAAFEIYRRDRARRIVSSMCRLGGPRIYARPARALKRALGLKFNPNGLGILNLSGFGLWRSDLLARRAGPYPR